MNLLEISIDKLKSVIISHKEELNTKMGSTEMLIIAKSVSESIKKNSKVEEHFHNLLKTLSFSLAEFSVLDYSSLDSFIEHSFLKNKQTCLEYLARARDEKDITKRTLLLKISNRMDDGFIPEQMILQDVEIKSKFPLFWIDILFKINRTTAINFLNEIIGINGFTFSEIFPVLDRWYNLVHKNDEQYSFYKENILQLDKNFTNNDLELYSRWLLKRDIKSIFASDIQRYKNKLQTHIKI